MEMQHIRVELLESAFLDRLRRDAEIADRIPFAVVRTSQPAVDSGATLRQQLETVPAAESVCWTRCSPAPSATMSLRQPASLWMRASVLCASN